MSLASHVVRAVIHDDQGDFALYGTGAVIVSGSLSLKHHWRTERLMTEGVNSVRSRRVSRQPIDLILDITEPIPAGQDLATRETAYAQAEGRLCTLTTLFGGGTHTWKNVIIESCEIQFRGFELIGKGAVTNSTRTLVARWVLVRQQEATA